MDHHRSYSIHRIRTFDDGHSVRTYREQTLRRQKPNSFNFQQDENIRGRFYFNNDVHHWFREAKDRLIHWSFFTAYSDCCCLDFLCHLLGQPGQRKDGLKVFTYSKWQKIRSGQY